MHCTQRSARYCFVVLATYCFLLDVFAILLQGCTRQDTMLFSVRSFKFAGLKAHALRTLLLQQTSHTKVFFSD